MTQDYPHMPIGMEDLTGLKLLIEMYLVHLRRETPATKGRAHKIQLLLEVRQKLIRALLAGLDPVTIPLTLPEWRALQETLAGCSHIIRKRIPSSNEREELLETLENLRTEVARIISAVLN